MNDLVVVALLGYGIYLLSKRDSIDDDVDVGDSNDFIGSNPTIPSDRLPALGDGTNSSTSDGDGDDGSFVDPQETPESFNFSSFTEFLAKIKELLSQGYNIQGLVNLGNSQGLDAMLNAARELREYVTQGIANDFSGWGQDEFDRCNDLLRALGTDLVLHRDKEAAKKLMASFESFITEVTIVVEHAKANPVTVYGAPKLSFESYEGTLNDFEVCSTPISCFPLTPKWDNMMLWCPRHRINQSVPLQRTQTATSYAGAYSYWKNFTDPTEFLAFMRHTRFNPNGKLALDAERGAFAFEKLGYDINIMCPRNVSLVNTNFFTQTNNWPTSGHNYKIFYWRLEKNQDVTEFKTACIAPLGLDFSIEDPTLAKLQRMLGIGRIGCYDLFFLENQAEDTGVGYEVSHFKATSRSSDVTVTSHSWLFNEMEGTMSMRIYPQTYFQIGTAAKVVQGRFFLIKRHGKLLLRGVEPSNIQFVGEFQSGMITPTLDYAFLETNKGLIIDAKQSSAFDSPLYSGKNVVIITKESCSLETIWIEDDSCLQVGQKKTISFQSSD